MYELSWTAGLLQILLRTILENDNIDFYLSEKVGTGHFWPGLAIVGHNRP